VKIFNIKELVRRFNKELLIPLALAFKDYTLLLFNSLNEKGIKNALIRLVRRIAYNKRRNGKSREKLYILSYLG